MSTNRSKAALVQFLDYLGNKGLMNANTVSTRKAAVNKVLGILSDEELGDVTQIDLDLVMTRFTNLEGQKYTPDSRAAYKSRVKASIEDFEKYLANPNFKPAVSSAPRKPRSTPQPTETSTSDSPQAPAGSGGKVLPSSSILQIQIRPEVVIYVQGLPFDLTQQEARRITNVINAMVAE